jgi:AraC family transcriptional regulator
LAQTPYLFSLGSRLGKDNVVLHARASRHRVEGFAGPLSVKTVVSGEVTWVVAGRELVVDPASFLVLADGEKYSMNIASARPVETCCVFFAPGFVEQLAVNLTSPLAGALNMQATSPPALSYLSALHGDLDRRIIRRAQNLSQRCTQALAPSALEEEFLDLGSEVLCLYARIRDGIAGLRAARHSTRQEVFRRLLVGREYFHSHASGPVSLHDVARAAGLSLFHFHRCFSQAFQQTPHSYLTNLRLQRARHLIEAGSSVLGACVEVGFASPSAFSRLFRSHFGEAPSAVRRKIARSGKTCA